MDKETKNIKDKNEQLAIVIGFFLIVVVIVITIFRSDLFKEKDPFQKIFQL